MIILALPLAFIFLNLIPEPKIIEETPLTKHEKEVNSLIEETWEEIKVQTTKQKIENLKNRFSLKDLLIKWDYLLEVNEPHKAITQYLLAYKDSPEDEKIIKKIAETYFELHKYKNSYIFYAKLQNTEYKESIKYITSAILATDINNEDDILNTINIIDAVKDLNEEDRFYYKTSSECLIDFHRCKKEFNEYLIDNPKEVKKEELLNIKSSIEKYRDFQVDEIYYKDALISLAFLNNWLYTVSAKISDWIISQKETYITSLKIWGKSYYKLWMYEKANYLLKKVFELEQSEDISFMLWKINFELWDYKTSNLYYQSALKNGYKNQTELIRKIVYNFYLLNDQENLITFFEKIVNSNEANQNDFYLWIYNAINSKNYLKWIKWIKLWSDKFPNDIMFRWYYAWIYRELWKYPESLKVLEDAYKIEPNNAFVNLNFGLTYISLKDYESATIFLEKTIELDKLWEFWEIASNNLEIINN